FFSFRRQFPLLQVRLGPTNERGTVGRRYTMLAAWPDRRKISSGRTDFPPRVFPCHRPPPTSTVPYSSGRVHDACQLDSNAPNLPSARFVALSYAPPTPISTPLCHFWI